MTNDIRKIVKEGYEQGDYAGHFRVSSDPNEMEKKYLNRLAVLLPKAAKVLDLGCGIGIPFDKYLVEKGFEVTGIDFASNHIVEAKKNVPDATFIEGDFSKTDFGGKRFHAIIAFYSIFHIPREEHQALFDKMHNLLENNGVILVTLGTSSEVSIEKDFVGAPMAWSNYEPEKYKAMIAQAGFEITESEYEGQPGDNEYHWWVLAKKK
ncbi:class I SAM-dependent methyltransferase [Patescibacteria group bacterium]